jgi:hypothetical protein
MKHQRFNSIRIFIVITDFRGQRAPAPLYVPQVFSIWKTGACSQKTETFFFHSNLIKQDMYYVPVKEGAGIAMSRAVTMFCLP